MRVLRTALVVVSSVTSVAPAVGDPPFLAAAPAHDFDVGTLGAAW